MEVISMLLFASLATAQQAHLVYDKHYTEPPQTHQNYVPPQTHHNYAPHSTHQQQPHGPWPGPMPNQPHIAMFPPGNAPPQPHQIQQPHQQLYAKPPHPHNVGPSAAPPRAIGIPVKVKSEFASRRGPIDSMIKGAKQYLPGGGTKRSRGGRPGTPIRFMEMNRLPKPPKYPLYDMPDLGMATPPPPPLMHPMGSATNMFQTYTLPNQPPQRGGRAPPRGKKPHRRQQSPMQRRPTNQRYGGPPPGQRSHRKPPHGKHNHNNHIGPQFDQGMSGSTNMDSPHHNSPPLGRPLNYDEYMKRPSHSFTDDPWNFDPYAANYNSGMNTFAMKYNYDPLGMNSLDKSQSHLDPEQLSYPGDTHTLQDAPPNVGKTTQLGGWDKSPETYRLSSMSPPPPKDAGAKRTHNFQNQQQSNSFNQFYDQTDSPNIVQSDSINPLKILSDANPGVEFTIESSSSGDGVGDTLKGGSSNYDQFAYDTWKNYKQQGHDVYGADSEGQYAHTVNNYAKTGESQNYLKQLQDSSKFENGNYDASTQLHTFALSQDYIPRERPLSDYSDSFNPHSGADVALDLTPPSETAAMFKRQGSRHSRQEKTPLIELEGLSLFKDLLKNDKAGTTRNQLIRVLTN